MTKRGRGMAFAVDLVGLCIFFLFISRRGLLVVHHPYYCPGANETVRLVFFVFVCLCVRHVVSCCLCYFFDFFVCVHKIVRIDSPRCFSFAILCMHISQSVMKVAIFANIFCIFFLRQIRFCVLRYGVTRDRRRTAHL